MFLSLWGWFMAAKIYKHRSQRRKVESKSLSSKTSQITLQGREELHGSARAV